MRRACACDYSAVPAITEESESNLYDLICGFIGYCVESEKTSFPASDDNAWHSFLFKLNEGFWNEFAEELACVGRFDSRDGANPQNNQLGVILSRLVNDGLCVSRCLDRRLTVGFDKYGSFADKKNGLLLQNRGLAEAMLKIAREVPGFFE